MADVPFLGCKISLISKCDIRYEGILYCVDPKESTIALSKVKSYGTETRGDSSCFVPPKNDIYDIIIFRASDVKDLRVDAPEPPGLSDPAIISARQSNTAFDGLNNGSLSGTSTTTATNQSTHQQQSHHQQQQKPLLPFLPTGSKDHQQSQAASHQQQAQQSQQTINYSSAVARRARPEKRSDDNKKPTHDSATRDAPKRDDRRRDDKRDDRRDQRRDDRPERRNDDRRDDRRGGGERRGDDRRQNTRVARGGYDRNHSNTNSRFNNASNYNNSRRVGSNNYRDDNSKSGPPYRRGQYQGGRRGRSGDRTGAPRGARKSAPIKFESDYDFDEANKIFLELEGKLKGMKIKGDEKDGEASGDGANSKSPAGQSESGSGYDSEDQNKDGDSKDGYGESVSGEYYDRTKSFFDNISCEASERSQGKVNKPDWRKERQTNTETFGVSANYRRGGYRGRSYGANGYHRR